MCVCYQCVRRVCVWGANDARMKPELDVRCVWRQSAIHMQEPLWLPVPSCPAVWHSPTLRYPGDRRGTFRMGICCKHIQYNRCIDAVFYQILCTESGIC